MEPLTEAGLAAIRDGLVPFQNVEWKAYTRDMLEVTKFQVEGFGKATTELVQTQPKGWRDANREEISQLRRIQIAIIHEIDEAIENNLLDQSNVMDAQSEVNRAIQSILTEDEMSDDKIELEVMMGLREGSLKQKKSEQPPEMKISSESIVNKTVNIGDVNANTSNTEFVPNPISD